MRPRCPVCKKLFWCDWPNMWAYKRDGVYLCSWGCLRKYDERKEAKEMKTLTTEEKRTACEVALTGGNPSPYLKGLGVTNVTTAWATCKTWARGNLNQDEYEKLPEKLGKTPAKTVQEITEQMAEDGVELVYDPSIAEEYKAEKEAKKANEQAREEADEEMNRLKIFREIDMEPLEVCGVRSRVLKDGVYTRNTAGNAMILSGLSMADDHLGLRAETWSRLSAEILLALKQLGIKGGDPEDYTGNNGPL